MTITQETDTRKYLDLLHLCEEDDEILADYLDRGELFVLSDPNPIGVCLVTKEGDGLYEIKNIAVRKDARRKGYGTALVSFVYSHYPDLATLMAGSAENDDNQRFYLGMGFFQTYKVRHYFRANYGMEDDDDDLIIYSKTREKA